MSARFVPSIARRTPSPGYAPHRACLLLLGGYVASVGAYAADLEVTVRDANGAAVDEAVVALYGGPPAAAAAPVLHTMDQVDKQFVPRLLAIHTGDDVRFPNSDDIRHHVYSFSPAKTFELPLYRGVPAAPLRFDVAGKVTLGCNIHDRMSAHVYVVDAPRYAVTTQGQYVFHDVAPGDYAVAVFHPRLPPAEDGARRTLVVGNASPLPFTFAIALSPPKTADDSALSPLERKFRSLRHGAP